MHLLKRRRKKPFRSSREFLNNLNAYLLLVHVLSTCQIMAFIWWKSSLNNISWAITANIYIFHILRDGGKIMKMTSFLAFFPAPALI